MMIKLRRRSRGVSLIEALVALAIVAFGMLGVAGMQASMRSDADLARQRAEAVRLAQAKLEDLRTFGVLSGAPTGERSYATIATGNDTPAAIPGYSNTTYARTWSVADAGVGGSAMKVVSVEVNWPDRSGVTQRVNLVSNIARVAPELVASLGMRGDRQPTQAPGGRHVAIPLGALNQPPDPNRPRDPLTSTFVPPGGGQTWTFNNVTGFIQDCITSAGGPCAQTAGWLLSGYINTALTSSQPTSAESENPPGPNLVPGGLRVQLRLSTPANLAERRFDCHTDTSAHPTAYYCLVPVPLQASRLPVSNPGWSGCVVLLDNSTATSSPTTTSCTTGFGDHLGRVPAGVPTIATSPTETAADRVRICRYSPNATTTNPDQHPAIYSNVNKSLANKNFLIIWAGNGPATATNQTPAAFTCPVDSNIVPVDGNTFAHQPGP